MSNDFRSLLSNFQSATGTATATPKANNSNTSLNNTNNKSSKDAKSSSSKTKLKELTLKLWQQSQLRQSILLASSSSSNNNKQIETKKESTIHLAICLCIVDELPHANLWEYWMNENNNNDNDNISAEVYIHAKWPDRVKGNWTRSKLIPISHCPEWNDVKVVKAMLSLIQYAVTEEQDNNDNDNTSSPSKQQQNKKKKKKTTHVLFGTESCIPICSLQDVSKTLLKYDDFNKSFIHYHGKDCASRFEELQIWNVVQQYIPSNAIHKALPGWCLLSRQHALDILHFDQNHLQQQQHHLYDAFVDCWAPEEVFFPTALALLGHLPNQVERMALTYSEWDTKKKSNHSNNNNSPSNINGAHPKIWDNYFNASFVSHIRRNHGCFFLRKMKRTISLDEWKRAVMDENDQGHKKKRKLDDQT